MASKTSGARKVNNNLPPDVAAIVSQLDAFFRVTDEQGRRWGDAKCGVYAFYDYDGEPIYIGQTREQLRVRIRRHMTNQRTDAVAMRVLDPLEVAYVEVWPYWDLQYLPLNIKSNRVLVDNTLNSAEYSLYRQVIERSTIQQVLNEKVPVVTELVTLPSSYRGKIVPDEIWDRLAHLDERIARRALKISELAQVIRQRDVSVGLRGTLVVQADRIRLLARKRFEEIAGSLPHEELEAEIAGSEDQNERDDDEHGMQ